MHPIAQSIGRAVLCFCLATVFTAQAGAAQTVTEEEKVKFSQNLLLPSPGEVFAALAKLGDVDFTAAGSFNKKYDYSTNALRALNLGVRAADGFLAVQAKDKTRLGEVIAVVVTLAEELLVKDAILNKGKQFENLAKAEKWPELSRELNAFRDDVNEEMKRLGDKDLSLLASAGGWLQGLRGVTTILGARFDAKASSVLYQPRLVDYFAENLTAMKPEYTSTPQVKAILAAMPEIKKLVDVGFKNPVPKENVERLKAIASELTQTIEKG